jgi:ribosomal subunit interface protein
MKLSISCKYVEVQDAVEAQVQRCVAKLVRLLKSYEPDLVQLHGVVSRNSHNEEYSFSWNLSLPSGTLHATGVAGNARSSCKQAFAELEGQVKKHQARLRKDYEWKRKRPRTRTAEAL